MHPAINREQGSHSPARTHSLLTPARSRAEQLGKEHIPELWALQTLQQALPDGSVAVAPLEQALHCWHPISAFAKPVCGWNFSLKCSSAPWARSISLTAPGIHWFEGFGVVSQQDHLKFPHQTEYLGFFSQVPSSNRAWFEVPKRTGASGPAVLGLR